MKKRIIVFAVLIVSQMGFSQDMELSLQEALKRAMENSATLKVSKLQTEIQGERLNQVKGEFRPTIQSVTNYAYFFERQVIFMPGAFTGNNLDPVVDVRVGGNNTFSSTLGVMQPILSPLSSRTLQTEKVRSNMQFVDETQVQLELIEKVSHLYYSLQFNESMQHLLEESLNHQQEILARTKELFYQGKALGNDTLQDYLRVQNVSLNLSGIRIENDRLRRSLQKELGLEPSIRILLTESWSPELYQKKDLLDSEVSKEELIHTPEMMKNQLALDLALAQMEEWKARRLPTLSAMAQYQVQMQTNRFNEPNSWPTSSFVGLQLNIPIYNGNRISSGIHQAKLQQEQRALEFEDRMKNLEIEISTLESSLKELTNRMLIQQVAVSHAVESFEIEKQKFKNGIIGKVELLDAELALQQAKLNLFQSVFNINLGQVQLNKILGKGIVLSCEMNN